MKIYVYKKNYNKESKEVRNAIINAVNVLYDRIKMYENQGIAFNRIFNDDKVKYDIIHEVIKMANMRRRACNFNCRLFYQKEE